MAVAPWPLVRLGDLIHQAAYGTSVKCHDTPDGIPVLRMGNVRYDGSLDLTSLKYARLSDTDLKRFGLNSGDIIFNRTNSKELVGKTGLWDGRFQAAAASYFIRIRLDTDFVTPEWVWHYMNSSLTKHRLFETARGAIGQANINGEELKAFVLPLPPLDEQRRIVSLLDRAAEIRRRADAARAKARAIIPALFLDMFGDPASNPKGWSVVALGDVIARITGGKNIEAGNGTSQYRILKVSAVTSGVFRASEAKPAPDDHIPAPDHHVRNGDFLFSRANTSELVGAVAIAHEPPTGLLLPDKIWRIEWDQSRIDARYAYSLLRTTEIRRIFAMIGSGTSGSMKNISQAKLVKVEVPLPPLGSQTAFADQCRRLESLARHLDAAAAKADAMAAALSAEIFGASSGKGNGHAA